MQLPQTTFSFIYHFVRQRRFSFILFIVTSIIWGSNDALFPYLLKHMVDLLHNYQGEPSGIYRASAGLLLLIVAFWLLTELTQRTQGIIQIYTFPYFRANIRAAVFDYVKSHSHEYFANNFAGNIAKKLADLPTSCQTILEIICYQFVTALTGSIIVIITMWLTKPLFAFILLAWLCLHLGLSITLLRRSNRLWEFHSDSVTTLSGKIIDVFTNMFNVRSFANAAYEAQYLNEFQAAEIAKAKKAMWLVEGMRSFLAINGLVLIAGMLFTLLYGWTKHWVTLGDFTQITMQSFWLLGWIWFISYQLTVFIREIGTVSDALSLIKKGHDLVDAANAAAITIQQGQIQFEKVLFSYSQNKTVFQDLDVVIPGGQKVGLVGFSGSGKSTFINLILRFYDLNGGKILIDNQDIAKVTQDSLRSQIAVIPQDPSLFHRTLMENIRYGRLNATDEEVFHAAKLAHCHEFIEKLDEGYQSLVGERGIKLSGGQRQRIAIARAILKDAPILILDEATSSLDSVTEKLIHDSLKVLMQHKTTIVVAHRLSTLNDMDRILVFEKGQIVEDGTKEHLLKIKGHFAKLWNMQTDGFLPEDDENQHGASG